MRRRKAEKKREEGVEQRQQSKGMKEMERKRGRESGNRYVKKRNPENEGGRK